MPLYLQTAEKPFRMMNIVSENYPDEFSDVKKNQVACFLFMATDKKTVRIQGEASARFVALQTNHSCTTHNPNT